MILRVKRHVLPAICILVTFILSSCMKELNTPDPLGEFFTFTVDGVTHTWKDSPYHLYAMEDTTFQNGHHYNMIGAYNTATFGAIDMVILRPLSGPSKPPMLFPIESIYINDPVTAPEMLGAYFPQLVSDATITEFGPIGGYVSGHFSGIYIKSTIPVPTDTVTVSCSWRIKREPF
jgi:hypothetical protein